MGFALGGSLCLLLLHPAPAESFVALQLRALIPLINSAVGMGNTLCSRAIGEGGTSAGRSPPTHTYTLHPPPPHAFATRSVHSAIGEGAT